MTTEQHQDYVPNRQGRPLQPPTSLRAWRLGIAREAVRCAEARLEEVRALRRQEIQAALLEGASFSQIGVHLALSTSTVWRIVNGGGFDENHRHIGGQDDA